MLIQRRLGLRGFGDAWIDWCNSTFPGDPTNLTKCNSKPFGPLTLAPWTDVGALQRGIPKPNSILVSAVQGSGTSQPASATSAPILGVGQEGIFGVPRTILLAGGAVLVGGLGLVIWKKHRSKSSRRR